MTDEQKIILEGFLRELYSMPLHERGLVDFIYAIRTLAELELERQKNDSRYAHFVIRDNKCRMFVGPSHEHYRVARRHDAMRFTMAHAHSYIEVCEGEGDFVIEDFTHAESSFTG